MRADDGKFPYDQELGAQVTDDQRRSTTQTTKHKKRYRGMTGIQVSVLAVLALLDCYVIHSLLTLWLGPSLQQIEGTYFGILFIPTLIARYLLIRFEGPLKRGVAIWNACLSDDEVQYLHRLTCDIETDAGFFRVNGRAVLIRSSPPWHTAWPFVGYIDLSAPKPKIEYRTGLPGVLILIPFGLGFILLLGLSFLVERNAILKFITQCMR